MPWFYLSITAKLGFFYAPFTFKYSFWDPTFWDLFKTLYFIKTLFFLHSKQTRSRKSDTTYLGCVHTQAQHSFPMQQKHDIIR